MLPMGIKDEFVRATSVSSQTNAAVRMRDGTVLRADVYRPAGAGRFPTLLQRIPYGKHSPRYRSMYLDPMRALDRGYAVVISGTCAGGTLRMGNGIRMSMRRRTGSIRLTG